MLILISAQSVVKILSTALLFVVVHQFKSYRRTIFSKSKWRIYTVTDIWC